MIQEFNAIFLGAFVTYLVPRFLHLARHGRSEKRTGFTRTYVCAPLTDSVEADVEAVRAIARRLAAQGELVIAPHLILPGIVDVGAQRDRALRMCLSLIELCAEVRVYSAGAPTENMRLEMDYARSRGIRVVEERT